MTPLRPGPPRFFLDRGLGSQVVPGGLRQAGWEIATMDERYGRATSQRIPDTQWIREATAAGENLLCKDAALAKIAIEAETVYLNDARVFVLTDAQLTGPAMLEVFLAQQEAVFRWAARVRAPFVAGVSLSGVRRLKLHR